MEEEGRYWGIGWWRRGKGREVIVGEVEEEWEGRYCGIGWGRRGRG